MRTQLDLDSLDPGIRHTVGYLRSRGFDTTDSGDGEHRLADWYRDHPHVVIRVPPDKLIAESRRLVRVLADVGVAVTEQTRDDDPCIQASYDPANNVAIIDLSYVRDSMLRCRMEFRYSWVEER